MKEEVYEVISKKDESKVLKEVLLLDCDKLDHHLALFTQWVSSQKQLPQNTNQNYLRKFLIWSKLDIEKAKKKFLNYCYGTLTHQDFVGDRIITREGDLKCLEYMYLFQMPKLTPERRCRVNVLKIFDPDNYDTMELCRFFALVYDFWLHVDNFHGGYVGIFDFQHVKAKHYAKLFTLTYLRYIRFHFQNFPFRIEKLLIINMHPFLEKGINLCLTLFPEKIKKRTLILGGHKDLHKHVSLECLPLEYEGGAKCFRELQDDWTEMIIEHKDLLKRVSEDKPTGRIPKEFKQDVDSFGIDGSFRKLNID